MSPSRSQRLFFAVVALTTVIAVFVPTRWMQPVTGFAAGILSVPVQPFGDFAVRVRDLIWSPDDPLAGESERVRYLTEQLELARRLAHARQCRIDALQEELRELSDAHRYHRGEATFESIFARITARSADGAGGLLRLNVGTRHGVVSRAVAVFRGGHLIGSVSEDPGRLSSWLVPVTDPASGLIEAVVLPAGVVDADLAAAPRVHLSPDGEGGLVGEVPRDSTIGTGDVVEVVDPTWPESAWGLKLGVVESVAAQETNPLRDQVRVVPRYPAHRLATVTLKIERPAELSGGAP